MSHRKPVTYALLVAFLLIASVLGAYSVNAQGTTPPAPPTGFQPGQMMDAMGGMLDQMEALLAATDHAAHLQMAPAMLKILEGMQELGQPVTEQIHGRSGPEHEAQMQRMGESSARIAALTERLHGMAGHGAAQTPATESAQPAPAAPAAAQMQMQMGQQMQMMGMMMQMMGMMQSRMAGEMMGGQGMQMDPMMEMMGKGMMGKGMMGGEGMMGGGGMGRMGAGSPMTATAEGPAPAPAPAAGDTEQSVEGGGVTVKVTPATLHDESATTLDFAVSLDTHTVELNYDLAQLALLTDNLGNEYAPAAWTPEQSGGHHVGGLLSFADRATILQDGVTEVTLTVKDVAGVAERTFVWSVAE